MLPNRGQRTRQPRASVALTLLATMGACGSSEPPEQTKAFEQLAQSPLLTGKGLGFLRLGDSTLRSVVERLGDAQPPHLVQSDPAMSESYKYTPTGVQLCYRHKQLCLVFRVEGPCFEALDGLSLSSFISRTRSKGTLGGWPQCETARLATVTISARRDRDDTWYQGATGDGITLGMPAHQAFRLLDAEVKAWKDALTRGQPAPNDPLFPDLIWRGSDNYHNYHFVRERAFHFSAPIPGQLIGNDMIALSVRGSTPSAVRKMSVYLPIRLLPGG